MGDLGAQPPTVSKATPPTIKQTPSTILPPHCSQINVKQKMKKTYNDSMGPEDNASLFERIYPPLHEHILSALESCSHALAIHHQSLINLDHHINCDKSEYLDRLEKVRKLQTDSMFVQKLLENMKCEMTEYGSFNSLIGLIEKNVLDEKEEYDTIANYKEAERTLSTARKTLEDEQVSHNHEIAALKAELVNLEYTKKKLKLKADVAMRYTDAWETAQCEKSSLGCSIILMDLNTYLHDCLICEKNEYRVARDIRAFLEQNIVFNEQATSHWRGRYDREMQLYEAKNSELRKNIESKRNTLEMLGSKYRERQKFIEDYLIEKEEARLLKNREQYRCQCAVKIQSWWRGVMVRRKLGPYRADEKKKKRAVKSKK